ncbi:MAG: KamA family radical SAM protein [Polyangiales bacterium]
MPPNSPPGLPSPPRPPSPPFPPPLPPALAPSPPRLDDWRWQARHAVTDLAGLERVLCLTAAERRGVTRAMARGLPLSITPYYLSLCDPQDAACPIRRQCVPTAAEDEMVPGDLVDPLGEEAHEVAPHLVRRYPDRALLMVTDRCGVYCRFCTRSRLVGAGGGARPLARLAPAFAWLDAHPEVCDLILSGGDPLVMSTARLAALLARVAQLKHIRYLRLATRAPVTLPQRIDAELCQLLGQMPALWLMTHFNHPKELTPEATEACLRLVRAGLPVMNQTVLLRGINDDADTLSALFRALVERRVRPYYLLQADPVRGTGHMRTPLGVGVALMEALQGRLSGIALPKFIVDTPGGHGKVSLSPEVVMARRPGATTLRTFRGTLVDYLDPPAQERHG